MKLHTHGLLLELTPRRCLNDEDWCRVQVVAQAPGLSADFEAWLQGEDLARFGAEVAAMHEAVGKPATAVLCSAEPDIHLTLAMERLGGIAGSYELRPEGSVESSGRLAGKFTADQSHLPGLISEVERLLAELAGSEA